jgi:hypothetical protein
MTHLRNQLPGSGPSEQSRTQLDFALLNHDSDLYWAALVKVPSGLSVRARDSVPPIGAATTVRGGRGKTRA